MWNPPWHGSWTPAKQISVKTMPSLQYLFPNLAKYSFKSYMVGTPSSTHRHNDNKPEAKAKRTTQKKNPAVAGEKSTHKVNVPHMVKHAANVMVKTISQKCALQKHWRLTPKAKIKINEIEKSKDHDILEEFHDVFTGLGQVAGEYRIELQEDAQPKIHPRRKVPLKLMPKLNETLDKLENPKSRLYEQSRYSREKRRFSTSLPRPKRTE